MTVIQSPFMPLIIIFLSLQLLFLDQGKLKWLLSCVYSYNIHYFYASATIIAFPS